MEAFGYILWEKQKFFAGKYAADGETQILYLSVIPIIQMSPHRAGEWIRASRHTRGTGKNHKAMATMKLFRLPETSRRWWLKVGCFVLLASSFTCAHALERPLTDADIARYLPRLREEASAFTTSSRKVLEWSAYVESAAAEHEALMEDLVSGKTDVLAWMRAQTEHALVPAKAVYNTQCSRAITAAGAATTAVFTFGKESPYRDLLRRAASGDEAALQEFHTRRGEEETGKRSPASQAIRDLVAGIVSFYRDHGFVEVKGKHPVTVTFLTSPDPRMSVVVWEVNPYLGLLPRITYPECSALPTGPLVELEYMKPVYDFEIVASATAEEKPDPEYERVKEALILAQMDAADPSSLEIEIPPDAPPEAKKELRAMAALFTVRKANVAVFKRHEAALAPILEALLGETTEY